MGNEENKIGFIHPILQDLNLPEKTIIQLVEAVVQCLSFRFNINRNVTMKSDSDVWQSGKYCPGGEIRV